MKMYMVTTVSVMTRYDPANFQSSRGDQIGKRKRLITILTRNQFTTLQRFMYPSGV
jgi:hypothetical protein